ncbi:MAG TPA: type I polyketide synthase, partial [Thermoanaerobaculia bacterium]
MTTHEPLAADEAVAVIGMAARLPGAPDLEAFWHNLRDGVESVSRFSPQELADAGIEPALYEDPRYVAAAAVLPDIERFDAAFFGFNPREAELLDPQQRLFLECAWEALEDAGYDPPRIREAVGVYAGASMSTYLLANLYGQRALRRAVGDYQTMLGNDKDYLATRVSYKLGLRGPSMSVQTACSTSLVAVCLACQALLDEQCAMALAGGVSVRVPQRAGYLAEEGGILSPDGHCRAFDAAAQGTIGGNGAGVVVLKRLADALADGDPVRAVIRAAALNNDGAAKVGFTAPSLERQAAVVVMAQTLAGVGPDSVTYVEAHGTGTPLGDAIEVAALTRAFRAATGRAGFCALGSVKTNVGHLDAAAGVAGLIKTVLALEHRQLPPSLNFTRPHPQLELAGSPFYVNARLADWPPGPTPRRAGVSSFGIGGTNAHLVVEQAPEPPAGAPAPPCQLLVLSARSPAALAATGERLAAHLRRHPGQSFADVAYTCQVGRHAFAYRRALPCRGREEALAALAAGLGAVSPEAARARPVAFLFPGGGAQHAGMGRELYDAEPVFRTEVDRCLELLAPHLRDLGVDLRRLLYPAAGDEGPPLTRTATALPALFTTEYALAKLLLSWGIAPQAMIGHSLGEYVAAALAGVLSLADALALVALRGRLFERLPAGGMVSVPLGEHELAPLLGGELALAALNAPTLSVVAGPLAALAAFEAALAARGLETRRLHIDVAAHSPAVEPLLPELARFAATLELAPPRI